MNDFYFPESSNSEKLEHPNLSQESANYDNFSIKSDEVELVKGALKLAFYDICISETLSQADKDYMGNRFSEILIRMKKWQDERERRIKEEATAKGRSQGAQGSHQSEEAN